MAHVLIAQRDPAVRSTLARALQAEGHVVTEVSDGVLAIAALWVARRPLVALLDEHLTPLDATDLLELAADGEAPLLRHRYVVLTDTSPHLVLRPALRDALRRLQAPVLSVPLDVEGVCEAVMDAARYLPTSRMDTAEPVPWSARMEQLVLPVA